MASPIQSLKQGRPEYYMGLNMGMGNGGKEDRNPRQELRDKVRESSGNGQTGTVLNLYRAKVYLSTSLEA